MPLKRCQKDKKPGWKWGDTGRCFVGRGARAKALRQGRAIEVSKMRRKQK
jgi:hypothetical protein